MISVQCLRAVPGSSPGLCGQALLSFLRNQATDMLSLSLLGGDFTLPGDLILKKPGELRPEWKGCFCLFWRVERIKIGVK
jgi:hypothetical protein